MKKQIQILILGMGLMSVCSAQPSITESGIGLVSGTYVQENITNYVSPGSSGANQSWDLSSMVVDSSVSFEVENSSSTPYSSSFTNANIASVNSSNYSYYDMTSSAWQNYGAATSSGTILSYSNPEDIMRFPFTYNNNYTDSWYCAFNSAGQAYTRSGTTTVTADGYGTLKTPNSTYSNALRVHYISDYTDSTYAYDEIWLVISYHSDEYVWYANGVHNPLAAVTTLTIDVYDTVQGGVYYGTVSGINELTSVLGSYKVFPNPASDMLNLDVNLISGQKVEIKLYNEMGAEVQAAQLFEGIEGDNRYKIDIENLPQGIYYARIMMNGILTSTRQFLVSR